MNLLLYWGNAIWEIEAFSNVFLGIFAIMTIILLIIALQGAPSLFADVAINIVLVIIFWLLGFPIKGIIITLLVLHVLTLIGFVLMFSSGEVEIDPIIILPILYVIGDIIGMVLFFKNVL